MESEKNNFSTKDSITKIPERDIYYNSDNNNKPPSGYFIQRTNATSTRKEDIIKQNNYQTYPQLEITVENSETMDIGSRFIITPEGPVNSLQKEKALNHNNITYFGYCSNESDCKQVSYIYNII